MTESSQDGIKPGMVERLRVFNEKHPSESFRGCGKTGMLMAELEEAITGIPRPKGPFLVRLLPSEESNA
jgi:hypothetical protein